MCGIFAYIGQDTSAPKLAIEGLKKLEYRGYDSWGIAFQADGTLLKEKKVGKISDVVTDDYTVSSSIVIAHTRWATHGGVTAENTHPHCNKNASIAVVHNGIIENYEELRSALQSKGYVFTSETDTEVVAHLIDSLIQEQQLEFAAAATEAFKQLKGRYAVVVLHDNSDHIVAARQGSPLIIGTSNTGFFIASDVPAFLEHTRNVQYIDDGKLWIKKLVLREQLTKILTR